MVRVLVVEDSLIFRELLVRYLNADPDIMVVAVASNPFEARDAIVEHNPDVMTLDVELPKMDGIEFLRKLMPQFPVRTLVVSSLSDRVFDAMKAGAVEFVAKPKVTDKSKLEEFVKKELPEKVKTTATARLKKSYLKSHNPISGVVSGDIVKNDGNLIIAIGASTGGTEAISAILRGFGGDLPGVVITQHMPAGFTKMYAERLNQQNKDRFSVKEAENGDEVKPGQVLLAPGGDYHMMITRVNGVYKVVLKRLPKVNGHCPSVDVLFESVAKAAGSNALGIILTGMGCDGAKGLLKMRQAGARTIGQDESTCVVYGMPRVAYELGAVEYQDKLNDIAKRTYSVINQMQKN